MPRPKKKDGVMLSAYISKNVYEKVREISKQHSKSISDIVEYALKLYIENKDVIKEFEELSEKYSILLKAYKEKSKSNDFIDELKKVIADGITWRDALIKIGINDPKKIVEYYDKYTYPTENENIRLIAGIKQYYLANHGNAKSNIDFIFRKKLR